MIVIVMGVSGCGKSTVGALIARQLGAEFLDADDLHPPENKKRMSGGIPLTDENRLPWLKIVRDYADIRNKKGITCIIACSALKKIYRDILNQTQPTCYVFLNGSKPLIQKRMQDRSAHFMPASLLDSQFDALELPTGEANVVCVGIEDKPAAIASKAIAALEKAGIL